MPIEEESVVPTSPISPVQPLTDADAEDFNQQLQFIDSSVQSVNIFDQLPSYNYVDTEMFLANISKELQQQKTINSLLLSNEATVKAHVEKVKAFSEANSSKVEEQLSQLKQLAAELKEVVAQNTTLKEKFTEVTELTANEQYVALAKNIQELKKQKQDILEFLKNSNIIAPPLSA